MASQSEIVVRYAETDCMGIVHHSVYPVWFEVARTDYIRLLGMSYSDMEKAGVMLPVTGITCKYRLPARYEDRLCITARITRLTPARIEFGYTVAKCGTDEILAEGTSSHGFVDSAAFRPLNFKKVMPAMFALMQAEAERDQVK